jgi:hypothetical protein
MTPTIDSTVATAQVGHREDREHPRRRTDSRTEPGEASRRSATGPRTDRTLTLAIAAMEYIWLYDRRHGVSYEAIAARENVSVDRVKFGVTRSRAQESRLSKQDLIEDLKPGRLGDLGFRLTPLFPIGAFTPQSACPHRESMEPGSTLCCMVCHASGMDEHPGLRCDPQADASPEQEPEPAPDVMSSRPVASPETRKQRRRRQFAEAMAAQAGL